jgi:HAD superfamily hydrolase (TIGR01549 family)
LPVIDLILFDLDGTLVDHRGAQVAAIRQVILGSAGARLPLDDLMTAWSDLERTHWQRHMDGECSFTEQRRSRLREFLPLLGEPVPDDAGLDAWFTGRYLHLLEAGWACYPDVRPCLEALAGQPMPPRVAVLTNGNPKQQHTKLARFGLLPYFEAVLTPTELGTAKPDPATFATACAQLGTDPGKVLSVGDWLEGDVIAAARAGLAGTWLDRGADPFTGRPPDAARAVAVDQSLTRIEDLAKLPSLLGQL